MKPQRGVIPEPMVMLFKCPGTFLWDGTLFELKSVKEREVEEHVASGWFKSAAEAKSGIAVEPEPEEVVKEIEVESVDSQLVKEEVDQVEESLPVEPVSAPILARKPGRPAKLKQDETKA